MPDINREYEIDEQAVGCSDRDFERSTKYLLTINNPLDHGITRESLRNDLLRLSPIYFCISDEIGGETHTPHVHVYVVFENARRWQRIKKTFPPANIKVCVKSHKTCISYVFKEGIYVNSEKGTTNLRDTHEEYGKRPQEHQGQRNDLVFIYQMVYGGATNKQILDKYPQYFGKMTDIDRLRNYLKSIKKRKFRYVEVVYICGPTGTGKTSYVMDRFGGDVYRATDYSHLFDGYDDEPVLILDEFKGNVKLGDMLNYLDGHRHPLPARYNNKTPEYEKVYIISNTPFEQLYLDEMHNDPNAYNAWIRRFRAWMYFPETGEPWVSTSYDEYKTGIGISLDDFEIIETKETITKALEIEKHQQEVDEKNEKRKKMQEEVAEELKDQVEELNKLREPSTIVPVIQDEDELEAEVENDDSDDEDDNEEKSSEGENSNEDNS